MSAKIIPFPKGGKRVVRLSMKQLAPVSTLCTDEQLRLVCKMFQDRSVPLACIIPILKKMYMKNLN